jgi:hypothetical protein
VKAGNSFSQKFKALSGKISRLNRQAGDIAARMSETCDHPRSNRIDRDCEYDRYRGCLLLGGRYSASRRNNDSDFYAKLQETYPFSN